MAAFPQPIPRTKGPISTEGNTKENANLFEAKVKLTSVHTHHLNIEHLMKEMKWFACEEGARVGKVSELVIGQIQVSEGTEAIHAPRQFLEAIVLQRQDLYIQIQKSMQTTRQNKSDKIMQSGR